MFSVDNKREQYLQSEPVENVSVLSDVDLLWCSPSSEDGVWNTLPDDIVTSVVRDVDVVVRFGFGLITGRIIEEPEYGVLSAHGSDIREYRGLGPQLLFLDDEDKVTVTLQELSDDIDGGRIVSILTRDLTSPYTFSDFCAAVREIQTDLFEEEIICIKTI